MPFDQKHIRNFSVIAHIDHGKSTLCDRILEDTGAVSKREIKEQMLDSMDLERERGITIKLNAVTVTYKYEKTGETFIFNLIDTPGHVDFTYEVSRSLAACEGALLVVDATQGVQAQTLANVYLAVDNDLMIIPVINKIDLPSAMPELAKEEVQDKIGISTADCCLVSAKTGQGVQDMLQKVVELVPPPEGDPEAPLQALIFDSYYDSYRGVVVLIRIKNGSVKVGDRIRLMQANKEYTVTEVGIRTPKELSTKRLDCGEVGYLTATIKDIKDVFPGETITQSENPAKEPLPGYRKINPMVYCGLYPVESQKYGELKDALEKLSLNDASLTYEPESSQALGFGFRVGFLGLLHMDVVQERLEREYNLNLILTAPSVKYKVELTSGETITLDNPSEMPDPSKIKAIEEPFVDASIMTPKEYVGAVMKLCQERRGVYQDLVYFDDTRQIVKYYLPLSEIIFNFFDSLKSATKGYASLDYQLDEYRASELSKMDILLNGDVIDALSSVVYRPDAYKRGITIVSRLKKIIPAQQFEVPVQAAINGKVVARADIKSMRKDVLAKCYGGDISRKKKLLEKQKEGKKRMKAIGSVDVPQEAFMALLSLGDDDK
ncbi:MAG: translation elongation factor 4 [Bacilli bacterium]|jgi:GTP-binding protein LepA|nr:translation elongation factor 4 [Bacilli bacterium]MCH4211097.1 translation elongation factor 4 [Bacilli bacterium]MCH4278092.1 translation elongation factor 4 [Bacilli bacterium]MCI2055211.1 translation elongation factor 4 [Bacilli bacterium]